MGTYTDTLGATRCQTCPGVTYTTFPGSTFCEAYYINAPELAYGLLFAIAVVSYLSLIIYSGGMSSAQSLLVTLAFSAVPFLDIYSDILYIMTSKFYNLALLVTIILVFMLANCRFVYDLLYIRGAFPIIQEFPGYYLVGSNMLWLGHDSGRPLVNGKRHPLSHESHDGMDKLLQFYLLWIYLVVLQVLYIVMLYPLWIVLYSTFLVFWFFVGMFLFQTKLIAVGRLRNMWFSNWTQSDTFNIETSIDAGILNESTFYQFTLETAPQLVLQITNGFFSKSISSPPSVFSITFSVLIAVNGLYRFGYYLFWKRVTFGEIPLPLALKVSQIAKNAANISVRQTIKGLIINSRRNHYKLLALDKIQNKLGQLEGASAEILFLFLLTLELPEVDTAYREVMMRLEAENVLREAVAEIQRLKADSSIDGERFQQMMVAISARSRDKGYKKLSLEIDAMEPLSVAFAVCDAVDSSNQLVDMGIVYCRSECGMVKGEGDSTFEQSNPMHRLDKDRQPNAHVVLSDTTVEKG